MDRYISISNETLADLEKRAHRNFQLVKRLDRFFLKRPVNRITSFFQDTCIQWSRQVIIDRRNRDTLILFVLLFLTLWVRLSTQMMIHTGVDERDYWYSAKALTQGFAYPDLTHRTVRWAIILPVAALQIVFGTHPNVYYIAPILNALLQIFLLYRLGTFLKSRITGIIASLFLIFFPYQIRAASQVRPEIFSITYILLCIYLFFIAVRCTGKKRIVFLLLASFSMFLAYESKITNLFFLPGIFLCLLLYGDRYRIRDCFIFGGLLLFLFLGETAVYALTTQYRFGQLSIIQANHLSSDYAEPLTNYLQVFRRYSPEFLDAYWQLPFAVFAVLSFLYLARSKNRDLKILVVTALGFFFFLTFTVSSLHPLMVAEDFIARYFCAVLPFVFLVIAWFLDDLIRPRLRKLALFRRFAPLRLFVFASFSLCAAVSLVFSSPFVPSSARQFAHSPLAIADHPFAQTARYYRELNAAWLDGKAIVSAEGNSGSNAIETASRFFLSTGSYVGGKGPEPVLITVGAAKVYVLSRDGAISGTTCIQAIRKPFRIAEIPAALVPLVEAESFVQ